MLLVNFFYAFGWFTLYQSSEIWQVFFGVAFLGLSVGMSEAPVTCYVGKLLSYFLNFLQLAVFLPAVAIIIIIIFNFIIFLLCFLFFRRNKVNIFLNIEKTTFFNGVIFLYISEASMRGVLIGYTQISYSFGTFLVYLLNISMAWRTVCLVCLATPIITAIALCFVSFHIKVKILNYKCSIYIQFSCIY